MLLAVSKAVRRDPWELARTWTYPQLFLGRVALMELAELERAAMEDGRGRGREEAVTPVEWKAWPGKG